MVIAILDVARGQAPTLFGWLGLLLIVIGCVLAPLISLRDFSLKRYWNVTTIWIAVTALGTIGYTAADSDVAKLLSPGLVTAVRYHVLESCMALIGYWAILSVLREPVRITVRWSDWRSSGMATAGLFGSYALILWAYQLSEHISYIVAVRQLSIVLGIGAAVILFREPSPRFRLVAALLITGGTMCISLGG
jgi:drug/metabolite transporter (DMT)-like permease